MLSWRFHAGRRCHVVLNWRHGGASCFVDLPNPRSAVG
ncbi:hypothetical protein CORAM0001_2031 [Corynebacterium amycolatum SK46]|nr:hypothetical protein CORAM0001_2031 [Corynebacterium amycolatum SK46]